MGDETVKTYSLRLSGDGINVEQQIEQPVALQIVQVILGGGAPVVAAQNSARSENRPSGSARLSLREYLDNIGASKKPDQITTIAHYVLEYEGQDDFGRDEIRSRFLAAREPLPANFARDFSVAQKNGWIAEVHGKKSRFYVTAKGLHAIGNNFSNGKGASARR
ncbi:MAG TPA: hypothetical protein VNX86_03930 [Rhizomicrobium sp.]|jgi:hypothetical protein|nr:hypothetical protein [Rhizomicrobium sp.]